MAIISRYVDCDGYIQECSFEVINFMETTILAIKKEIYNVLVWYDILVKNFLSKVCGASYWGYVLFKVFSD